MKPAGGKKKPAALPRGRNSAGLKIELPFEDAIRAAAPEVESIEVIAAEQPKSASVIAPEALMNRLHNNGHSKPVWHQVPDVSGLAPGEVGGFRVDDITVLACRVAEELFAYRDRCGACGESLAGAALPRCHSTGDGSDARLHKKGG